MEEKSYVLSLVELENLVEKNIKPEWWNSSTKITYGFAKTVFESVEQYIFTNGGSQEDLVRKAFMLLDPNLQIGKKIANVKRKIFNTNRQKFSACDVCLFLYSDSKSDQFETQPFQKDGESESKYFLGELCAKHEITMKVLNEIANSSDLATLKCPRPRVIIENELILELNNVRIEGNFTWKMFSDWLYALSLSRPEQEWNETSINSSVNRLVSQRQTLLRNKRKEEVEELLKEEFCFPKPKVEIDEGEVSVSMVDADELDMEMELAQCAVEMENYKKLVEKSDSEVLHLTEMVEKGVREREAGVVEIRKLKEEIKRMNVERKEMSHKLQKALDKLGNLSARNVNKRIRNREKKNNEMEGKLEQQAKALGTKEEKYDKDLQLVQERDAAIAQLVEKLNCSNESKMKALRMKSYFKRKSETTEPINETEKIQLKSKIQELKDTITELQNEKARLEERVEVFMQNKAVKTFQNGKYTDTVRDVYEDLLCMGVSAENCEKVVREVLEEMAGVTVGRLPKETFARSMYLEARRMAQMQVTEELVDKWDEESRTLLSDGTSKWHHKYLTYQIKKDDGKCLVLGMREVAGGDAETQLNVLKEVMKEVVASEGGSPDQANTSSSNSKIIASIRNLMSDRCGVQKKFNDLMADYRKEIVPEVIAGWATMGKEEQTKLLKMNDFFCGLHLLVAFADQAEATLKLWDKLIHEEKAVGSLKKGCGGFSNSDSGTYRLVRTVCKAVQERGCEKSGRPVQFAQFVQQEGEATSVPLVPFKGNRFNIFFHNGGGVFYLYEDLKKFFEQVKEGNNLLKAVYHDLQVVSFLAGCRALGLIDKLVTTPLWKILEDPSVHVLDMSRHYQTLRECFSSWAEDASGFLKGEELVFPHIEIRKGPVYTKLVAASPFWDGMTQQVLELIFGSLAVKTTALLPDHLKDGKYDLSNTDEDLKGQTASVPKTNVEPEEVFGIVDAMMKQKPNAHTFVIESLVMQKKNKMSDWRKQLDPAKKAKLREQATRGAREDQKLKVTKKLQLQQTMAQKRARDLQEKEEKARKVRVEKTGLMDAIEKMGGLWKTEEEINSKIEELSTEKEKKEALKTQIIFRKKVLGATHPDKKVFQMSAGGQVFTVTNLKENLMKIVKKDEEDRQEELQPQILETESDWTHPKLLTPNQLSQQKGKMKEMVRKEEEKSLKRKGDTVSKGGKRRKNDEVDEDVPIIAMPEDLIGKRIEHLVKHDEASDEEWWKGTVGDVLTRGRNPKFMMRYDGFEDDYQCRFSEYKNGDIRATLINNEDLLGKKVAVLLENDDDGDEDRWTVFKVVGINERVDSSVEFLVQMESEDVDDEDSDSDDDSCDDDQDIFSFPLIEFYLNNALRLLLR